MKGDALDVFSVTNPALCGLVIWAFCKSYHSQNGFGCEHPLLFIPVPFCLSAKVRNTLSGTNGVTGFMNWLQKNPELILDFPELLSSTTSFTSDGLLFALTQSIIEVDENGLFLPSKDFNVTEYRIKKVDDEILQLVKSANKIGGWLGQLNNLRATFQSMGITL